MAKIRNRYSQVPHLTQDTNGKVTTLQLDTTGQLFPLKYMYKQIQTHMILEDFNYSKTSKCGQKKH